MLSPLTAPQQELLDWIAAYIQQRQISPSLREMMRGVGLRSPAPVQSRLRHLQQKGYVDWSEGKARSLRLLHLQTKGVPLLGTIAASGLITTFADTTETFDLFNHLPPGCYALRVAERTEALLLQAGDLLFMQPVTELQTVCVGAIALVEKQGQATLHRVEQASKQMTCQGVMVGVWRSSL